MSKEDIKKEIENYKNLKWYESSRGKSVIALIIIFLITSWHRLFLSLLILPIIYFVKKGSKSSMILGIVYSCFLTIVNIAVYITNNRDDQGGFYSSMMPIYLYLGLLIFIIFFLKKSYKVEKSRDKAILNIK